ncbi:MAG: Fic family protein, partial [Bifidobacteriaceae bacterium]|nr:Fic family protein [Bifidobacteriaceae bacterium]
LASFSDDAPHNSKMISNNIQAMLEAIHKSKELSKKTILDIHNALMGNIPSAKEFAGKFRTEQVWIGGSNLGPFNAYFVPPDYKLIDKAINDLILFINSDKINPIVKAAISHAQFETIHPFVDGNGRTGRSLLHAILLHDEALLNTSVPISAGLLNNLNSYFKALDSYREGNELLIIDRFCDAIIEAVKIASILVEKIEELLDFWRNSINARSDAKIWDLLELLIEQPVVGAQFISERLSISLKASYNVIDFAIEKNILQKIGNKYRGVFYVCNSVTDLLDSISSEKSLRRLLPKS